jgi:predicted RNase H-like HicB family nuclease
MKYLIILEPTETGYSAYSPDLDGCVAAGDDKNDTIALMQEAIAFHLEGLEADGYPVPSPRSEAAYIEVAAPGVAVEEDRPR